MRMNLVEIDKFYKMHARIIARAHMPTFLGKSEIRKLEIVLKSKLQFFLAHLRNQANILFDYLLSNLLIFDVIN